MAKILVIEDELNIARAVKDKLSHEGHHVELAYSGQQGLGFVKNQLVDLIILDLLMPEMDGFEVIERLKADPTTKSIPIILLSVLSEDPEDERFKRIHPDGYLTKPYKGADLIKIVNKVLKNLKMKDD
ncbi:response regulator [bacterium]|nr:response regulator [bacterium]